jgi:hypothetical protein
MPIVEEAQQRFAQFSSGKFFSPLATEILDYDATLASLCSFQAGILSLRRFEPQLMAGVAGVYRKFPFEEFVP